MPVWTRAVLCQNTPCHDYEFDSISSAGTDVRSDGAKTQASATLILQPCKKDPGDKQNFQNDS